MMYSFHMALTLTLPSTASLRFLERQSVEAEAVELSHAAEELGDIPDRFMCPIGCDIMRDPVTLPTSGQVPCVP